MTKGTILKCITEGNGCLTIGNLYIVAFVMLVKSPPTDVWVINDNGLIRDYPIRRFKIILEP